MAIWKHVSYLKGALLSSFELKCGIKARACSGFNPLIGIFSAVRHHTSPDDDKNVNSDGVFLGTRMDGRL